MEINFITSNPGKVKSLEQVLKSLGREDIIIKQVSLDIIEPQSDDVAEVSKYKARQGFEALRKPVLVEDGGMSIEALNGFPGVYTKYVMKTIGVDGILKLMNGEKKRSARFVSIASFADEEGNIHQFGREGDGFEIAAERKQITRAESWSDIWQIMYMKDYGKTLCEFSEDELIKYCNRSSIIGSLQNFGKWFLKTYAR